VSTAEARSSFQKALAKEIAFDDFNVDNDPLREHDFGAFELKGEDRAWESSHRR